MVLWQGRRLTSARQFDPRTCNRLSGPPLAGLQSNTQRRRRIAQREQVRRLWKRICSLRFPIPRHWSRAHSDARSPVSSTNTAIFATSLRVRLMSRQMPSRKTSDKNWNTTNTVTQITIRDLSSTALPPSVTPPKLEQLSRRAVSPFRPTASPSGRSHPRAASPCGCECTERARR